MLIHYLARVYIGRVSSREIKNGSNGIFYKCLIGILLCKFGQLVGNQEDYILAFFLRIHSAIFSNCSVIIPPYYRTSGLIYPYQREEFYEDYPNQGRIQRLGRGQRGMFALVAEILESGAADNFVQCLQGYDIF